MLDEPFVEAIAAPVPTFLSMLTAIIVHMVYAQYVKVSLAAPPASSLTICQDINDSLLDLLCVIHVMPTHVACHGNAVGGV